MRTSFDRVAALHAKFSHRQCFFFLWEFFPLRISCFWTFSVAPFSTKHEIVCHWSAEISPVKITNRMLRTGAAFMSRIGECSKDFSVEMLSGVTLFLDLLRAVVSAYTIVMSSSGANAFIWCSNLYKIKYVINRIITFDNDLNMQMVRVKKSSQIYALMHQ